MHGVRALASRIAAVLLAAVALHAHAAPFAVSIGGDRVVLDAIPGFTDTLPSGSPRLLELAESLTSASNRILLFALTDADVRRFGIGDRAELKRYMIAVTPGHLQRERVNAAQFRTLIADAQRDAGKPGEIADFRKHLDGLPHGRVAALAQLGEGEDLYSVLLGTRMPGESGFFSRDVYLVSTNTLLLVRGKALSLSVYSSYDSPADVEWIRFATGRWIDTLRQLNAR